MVRLLLGGDVMLGRGVADVITRSGPDYPLAPLAALGRAADLFFVNLECALTAREIRYAGPAKAFYFRAPPAAADTLVSAGVDLVALANNHALDANEAGLLDTLDILDTRGIAWAGAGADRAAANRPARLISRGQRFGVLACCDHQADFAATDTRPGIRYVDPADRAMTAGLAGDIRALRATVDHVVVAFHWQPNWAPTVAEPYRAAARTLVEAGAGIVWGHSPHHFQGVEWMGESVVLYSSGDLLDDYAVDPGFRNDRQLLFELSLEAAQVRAVRALPLELDFGHTRPAAPEAGAWIERRFRDACTAVGSRVRRNGTWLEVLPEPSPPRLGRAAAAASAGARSRPPPHRADEARPSRGVSRSTYADGPDTSLKRR